MICLWYYLKLSVYILVIPNITRLRKGDYNCTLKDLDCCIKRYSESKKWFDPRDPQVTMHGILKKEIRFWLRVVERTRNIKLVPDFVRNKKEGQGKGMDW